MSRKLFISYSHEDKTVAKQVAEALSRGGYAVFWDSKIPTGMTFDTYIYRELEDSDAVVVLWSKHSVHSDYVKEEAEYAKNNTALVPLRVDQTPLPFGFARIQTTDIIGWSGSAQAPEWQLVVDSIEANLNSATSDEQDELEPVPVVKSVKKQGLQVSASGLLAIAIVIVMILAIFVFAMRLV